MALDDRDFDVFAPRAPQLVEQAVELHGLSREDLNGKHGQAIRFDDHKMRMVVKVDGQQQPMLVRCRNLRLAVAPHRTPGWAAKYERADLQRYDVSLRVSIEQGQANSLESVERAIATLERATEIVGEDPRGHGMLASMYEKKSAFEMQTVRAQTTIGEAPCPVGPVGGEAALNAFKSSLMCLECSQQDTYEWSLATIGTYSSWRWLLKALGVAAERTIGVHAEQPAVTASLKPFIDRYPWLQDADQFEWLAERVTMIAPTNYEAWAMRGDAARGINAAPVAKEFYLRAAELCEADTSGVPGPAMGTHYREKAAVCDQEFHGQFDAANEKLRRMQIGS